MAKDLIQEGYTFAKASNKRKILLLSIITLCIPLVIIIITLYGFIQSLGLFATPKQQVNKVFTETSGLDSETIVKENQSIIDSYKNAGIPYYDPQSRFSIVFATPFVSDQVIVVIYSKNNYDSVKNDADTIIATAKQKVAIRSINYTNSFDN